MEWTFGTVLWSTLVFFFWFAVIWMFIGIFADIFRRDMSGLAKAGWVLMIVVLPFIGILAYIIARPSARADAYDSRYWAPAAPGAPVAAAPQRSAAEEIAKASELYQRGQISQTEFQTLKQQALA